MVEAVRIEKAAAQTVGFAATGKIDTASSAADKAETATIDTSALMADCTGFGMAGIGLETSPAEPDTAAAGIPDIAANSIADPGTGTSTAETEPVGWKRTVGLDVDSGSAAADLGIRTARGTIETEDGLGTATAAKIAAAVRSANSTLGTPIAAGIAFDAANQILARFRDSHYFQHSQAFQPFRTAESSESQESGPRNRCLHSYCGTRPLSASIRSASTLAADSYTAITSHIQ